MAPKKIKKRIAVACQGGGSHTAFTAGVLKKILSQRNKSFSNDKYKHIEIRWIRMLRELNYSKKLERRLEFIQDMIAYGERQTDDFLKGLKACK